MASAASSHHNAIRQDVLISTGGSPRHCIVLINPDCWTPDSLPNDIGGVVDLPPDEREILAGADRIILTLCENGEPYRMILDGGSGRFIARKL